MEKSSSIKPKKAKKKKHWVLSSLESNDGKASSRKLTAFLGMVMFTITWFYDLFYELTVSDLLIYGIMITTGLSLGLFTAQNIVDILSKRNSNNDFYQQNMFPPNMDDEISDDNPFPDGE